MSPFGPDQALKAALRVKAMQEGFDDLRICRPSDVPERQCGPSRRTKRGAPALSTASPGDPAASLAETSSPCAVCRAQDDGKSLQHGLLSR